MKILLFIFYYRYGVRWVICLSPRSNYYSKYINAFITL